MAPGILNTACFGASTTLIYFSGIRFTPISFDFPIDFPRCFHSNWHFLFLLRTVAARFCAYYQLKHSPWNGANEVIRPPVPCNYGYGQSCPELGQVGVWRSDPRIILVRGRSQGLAIPTAGNHHGSRRGPKPKSQARLAPV